MNTTELLKTAEETDLRVYKTTDYGAFKYIDANRTVNKRHVQEIINSMEANPEWLKHRPVTVNENGEIIDGQHRIQAASQLRRPIYFTIAEGTNVETAQLMNALQKGWSLIDFARSYALNRADPARSTTYKTFLALFEEYNMPVSLLISYCEQRSRHNATKDFKHGDLTIKDEETTRSWLNMGEEINEMVNADVVKRHRHSFNSALFKLFQNPDYDHERMTRKLHEKRLEPQMDRANYVRALEQIYNFNMKSEDSRVYFL